MPRRNNNSPERDEFGRFVSSDNYHGRSSRYRDEDDDDYYNNSSRYSNRASRHDNDYDDDHYSSRSSRGNRGQGWFGDSEGHARAGSLSHGGRSRSSGYDDYDEDDHYSSRSNHSSSDRSSRGRGWFGDSEGHARAGSLSHGGRSRNSGYDDYDDSYSSRRRASRY